MPLACPTGKEYEWLVSHLGTTDANLAVYLNKGTIPDLEKAIYLLENQVVPEKDVVFNTSNDFFKRNRIVEQMISIRKAFPKANKKQREILEKFLKMSEELVMHYTENIALIEKGESPKSSTAVSKFIGASEFKGDPKEQEAFKLFGIFVHEVLEYAQDFANSNNKKLLDVMTKDLFEYVYNIYIQKNPFSIENLSKETIYERVLELATAISHFDFQNSIILPEITVSGISKDGRLIVGRLDMTIIDSNGDITILDNKTKKNRLLKTLNDNSEVVDTNMAIADLSLESSSYPIQLTNKRGEPIGVADSFTNSAISKRNTLDNWILQLDMYENMLKQHGFSVKSKMIAALIYEIERSNKSYKASAVRIFSDQDYYDQAWNTGYSNENYPIPEPSVYNPKITALKKAVAIEMPTGEYSEEEITSKTLEELIGVTPTDEHHIKLISNLDSFIEGQISELYEVLKSENQRDIKNKDLIELIHKRITDFTTFKRIIEKARSENNITNLSKSVALYNVVNVIYDELTFLNTKTASLLDAIITNTDNIQHSVMMKSLQRAYDFNNSYKFLSSFIEDIINDISDPNSANDIRSKLAVINSYSANIDAMYRRASLNNGVKLMMSGISKKSFEATSKELREALIPRIETIKNKIEKLKNDDALNVLGSVKHKFISWLDKSYREKLYNSLDPKGLIVIKEIEALEKNLAALESQLNDFEYSQENFERFLVSVTDPESSLYIGSTPYTNSGILSNIMLDNIIASASNSDMGIAAFVMLYKDAMVEANRALTEDENIKNIDKILKKLLSKGYTLEQLNDMISERRTVSTYDQDGNLVKETTQLYLTKVYTEEYDKIYREYHATSKKQYKDLEVLKGEYYEALRNKDPLVENKKKLYNDKKVEIDKTRANYVEWMVNNASLPYSDKYYKLQKLIPSDIIETIQKLKLEQEELMYGYEGLGFEHLIPKEDYDKYNELEAEIKKIRRDARINNEEYAKYLEEFLDLYEYVVDDLSYSRKKKDAEVLYKDDPDKLKEWIDTYEVSRPKQEWYNELNELYEQRNRVFGEDPTLKALYERRAYVMSPYRDSAGRFNSKHLSEDDIQELDAIESDIEEYLYILSQSNKLTQQQKDFLSSYKKAMSQLATTVKSPVYLKTLNSEYNLLKKVYDDYLEKKMKLDKIMSYHSDSIEDLVETEKEYLAAFTAFKNTEELFKEWYEKNHYNNYVSIEQNPNLLSSSLPKGFNFVKEPVESVKPLYMETIPNPKYFTKAKLRRDNWKLDGSRLSSIEIENLKETPDFVNDLMITGRLEIGEGAYNDNYIKSPDGVPMPNNIVLNNNIYSATSSRNINSKYLALQSNPEVFELYNAITNHFFNIQKKVEGKTNGYLVPGYAANTVESFKAEGDFKSFLKNQVAIVHDKHLKFKNSAIDSVENIFGNHGSKTRNLHANQLPENLQSKDAIGSILRYSVEANYNIALQKVTPMADNYIEYIKDLRNQVIEKSGIDSKQKEIMTKRAKQLDNVISILEFERRKFQYGQSEVAINETLKNVVDTLFKYTSFIRIGFDVANQIKNYVSGNVQAFIAAGGLDSNHYSYKHLFNAKNKVYFGKDSFFANYFKDWGKINDLHLSTMLYRHINPLQKEAEKYYESITGGRSRKLAEKLTSPGELAYILQDKGDTEIGVTIMYAVMSREYKLKDDSGFIPAYDCYYKDAKGNLRIRQDVIYDIEDEKMLRNIIYSEMRRAQGNYAKRDQTAFEEKTLGKMMFFFRKYLIPQFLNRFGYLRPNWEGSDVAMGYWRAVGYALNNFGVKNTLGELILGPGLSKRVGLKSLNKYYKKDFKTKEITEEIEIGNFYSKKIAQARHDAIAMGVLATLSLLFLLRIKRMGDDDEELSMLEGNAIVILWGVKGETISMNPFGGGSDDYIRNFTQGITFARELQKAKKFADHAYAYATIMAFTSGEEPDPDYDSYYYQELWKNAFYSKKSGGSEKGDIKLVKDLIDLTGIKNFRNLLYPENKIDYLQKNI